MCLKMENSLTIHAHFYVAHINMMTQEKILGFLHLSAFVHRSLVPESPALARRPEILHVDNMDVDDGVYNYLIIIVHSI